MFVLGEVWRVKAGALAVVLAAHGAVCGGRCVVCAELWAQGPGLHPAFTGYVLVCWWRLCLRPGLHLGCS